MTPSLYDIEIVLKRANDRNTINVYFSFTGGPFIPIIIYVGLRLHIDDNE